MKFNLNLLCFTCQNKSKYRAINSEDSLNMFPTKSSEQLLAIRLLMRNMFLNILRQHNFPRLSNDEVKYDVAHGKDFEYLFEAYVSSEVWKRIPSVVTVARFNPNILGTYKLNAIKYCKWAKFSLDWVHFRAFSAAIDDLSVILDDDIANDLSADETLKRIKKVLTKFSKDMFEVIKTFTNDSQNIPTDRAEDNGFISHAQAREDNLLFGNPRHQNNYYREYRYKFWELGNKLRRTEISNPVLLFFCDGGIGAQGIYFIDNIRFPFVSPLIPQNEEFSNAFLHAVNENLYRSFGTNSLANNERQVQEDIENWAYHKLRSLKTTWLPDDDSDGEDSNIPAPDVNIDDDNNNPPDNNNNQNNDGGNNNNNNNNNNNDGDGQDQNDQNQQNNPNQGNVGGDQNQGNVVPDDTNYTPNSTLARLARVYTTRVTTDDDDNSPHDHMTRFGVQTEGPQSINRNDIRQGDYTVQERTWRGTTRYLVTYTRRSRKPIFNLIG